MWSMGFIFFHPRMRSSRGAELLQGLFSFSNSAFEIRFKKKKNKKRTKVNKLKKLQETINQSPILIQNLFFMDAV